MTSDTRWERLFKAAESRGIPLRSILAVVSIVVVVYLVGKIVYRLRDVLLIMVVAGFVAIILNPLVVALQHWRVKRRGLAVAFVTFSAVVVFVGLTAAFGYPLVNGLAHLAERLPVIVKQAEQGKVRSDVLRGTTT